MLLCKLGSILDWNVIRDLKNISFSNEKTNNEKWCTVLFKNTRKTVPKYNENSFYYKLIVLMRGNIKKVFNQYD